MHHTAHIKHIQPQSCDAREYDELNRMQDAEAATGEPVKDFGDVPGDLPANPPAAETDGAVLNPADPMPTARLFRRTHFAHPDCATLHFKGGVFYGWDCALAKYSELDLSAVRAKVYSYLEPARKLVTRGKVSQFVPFAPNRGSVDNAVDALRAVSHLQGDAPKWLRDDPGIPDAKEILATPAGLLYLPIDGSPRIIRPPTPLFFSFNSLDYAYDPAAPTPLEWLKFLDVLWPDDRESIELLQDWFGYCLLPLTYLQKMLLIVGPPRSGKGTIARVLTAMMGAANVCAPTLSGLATNFGLWSLIGKLLAIVSDARLSGRTDLAVVVERLLSISGEDSLTIDRKNLEPVTVRLPTRVMILTNELPRLSDASGALANRFMVLTLERSFLGHEDPGLTDRLLGELPGILNWSLGGLHRLRRRGHFVQPTTSDEAIAEMNDLASPVGAFIRDNGRVGPALSVPVSDLFESWKLWCKEQGRDQPGTLQVFGRDVRAAIPGIGMSRPRAGEERQRRYEGIALTPAAENAVLTSRGYL